MLPFFLSGALKSAVKMIPYQYMPPCEAIAAACAAAAASAAGSGLSVTSDSVVSTIAATDDAFSSAERVTFVGSRIPALNMSTYSSVAKLKP